MSDSFSADVVVVGSSAAGLSTAESLRRNGFVGSVRLVGAERHLPYDRPPLSKQVLCGSWPAEQAFLRSASDLAELGIDLSLGNPAAALDVDGHLLTLADGSQLSYGTLVIATGVRAKTLAANVSAEATPFIRLLRDLDDCLALRAALWPERRVVVIGAGVLGCELAAAAAQSGAQTTLIGRSAAPMFGQLGPELSQLLAEAHHSNGVTLLMDAEITGIDTVKGQSQAIVKVSSGAEVIADVVLVAIGAVPNTDWLEGSAVPLSDGVLCDESGLAATDVYAVGDLARWQDPETGASLRRENRTNALEQGMSVGARIAHLRAEALGAEPQAAVSAVPYYWTDQYQIKISIYGRTQNTQFRLLDGSVAAGRFVAGFFQDEQLLGVLGWNNPKGARLAKAGIYQPRARQLAS